MKTLISLLCLSLVVICSTNNTFGKTNSDTTKNSLLSETPKKKSPQNLLGEKIKDDDQQYWSKWFEQNSDFYVTELYTKKQSMKDSFLLLK